MPPNPGTVAGTLADPSMLFGGPDSFGGGAVPLFEEGNINRQVFGVAGASAPASTGGDIIVAVYALPANSFDVAGRGITITAEGVFAANGNTKRQKLFITNTLPVVGQAVGAGSLIGDGGAVVTNAGGWFIGANVFKRGATNSNTQTATSNGVINGAVHAGLTAPADLTLTENALIYVAVTINNTTAVGDSALSFFEINAMN